MFALYHKTFASVYSYESDYFTSISAEQCPIGKLYHDCHQEPCERSCQNFDKPDFCPEKQKSQICFPGCFCPAGTVRNGDKCVAPEMCRNCKLDQKECGPRNPVFDAFLMFYLCYIFMLKLAKPNCKLRINFPI
jgi:hypothetical protein